MIPQCWWQISTKSIYMNLVFFFFKLWQSSAVRVQNVLYKNIKGTSSSNDALILDCSENFPCKGIVLQDIDIQVGGGKAAKAVCTNALVTQKGDVSPNCSWSLLITQTNILLLCKDACMHTDAVLKNDSEFVILI